MSDIEGSADSSIMAFGAGCLMVGFQAQLLEKSIQLESMKADNLARQNNGAEIFYDGAHFASLEREVNQLSQRITALAGKVVGEKVVREVYGDI